jgi:hypothetical protein
MHECRKVAAASSAPIAADSAVAGQDQQEFAKSSGQ